MAFEKEIYKKDLNKNVRVWQLEYDEEKYRSHTGVIDGAIMVSGWKYPTEKNVGKSNGTTVAEQVLAEVKAIYEKQLYQGKYHDTIEGAHTGAKFEECMLADKYNPKKATFPYFHQPKLDGVRCLVMEDGMQTRNGKEFVSSPHIYRELSDLLAFVPGLIVDGELYNHDYKEDFEKIISLVRKTKPTDDDYIETSQKVEYHIYDVILEGKTFEERQEFIQTNIKPLSELPGSKLKIVQTGKLSTEQEAEEKLSEMLEAGYEGLMLRLPGSLYEHRRSKNLLKFKTTEDAEFVIHSISEGKGTWAGRAKTIEIVLENGDIQNSGIRGTFAFTEDLLLNRDKYCGTEVTVSYQNRTKDGKLRFPVATKFWKGKREV